jgi:putative DNA primase/helicase
MSIESYSTFRNSDDLLAAVEAMTPATPSAEAYEAIATTVRLQLPPSDTLTEIILRTGLAPAAVEAAHHHIVRHHALARVDEVDALALDALQKQYAYGLHLKVEDDRTLFEFCGTHWTATSEHALNQKLTRMTMERPQVYGKATTSVPKAIKLIKSLAPPAGDFRLAVPPPVINTETGEVWVGKGGKIDVRIHRPETNLRYVLPVAYDPAATSLRYDKAIAEIFSNAEEPDELLRHVHELMGYGLQGVRDIPVIGFFWGAGANGKSMLLNILKTMAGRRQVLAATLGGVSRDRFMTPNLSDKLLFVEDDAKDDVRIEDGLLKSVSENKIIDARRLGSSHAMAFCSMVMPLIAINGAPRLNDTSDGMRRRLHVIPFERQFTKDEIDPGLGRLIAATELPGVLNHFIEGLSRLRARGAFDPPKDAERAKDNFLAAANPLLGFLQERAAEAPGKRLPVSDLFQAYGAWMKQNGQRLDISQRSLSPRLKAMGYTVRKSNVMVVENLALRDA